MSTPVFQTSIESNLLNERAQTYTLFRYTSFFKVLKSENIVHIDILHARSFLFSSFSEWHFGVAWFHLPPIHFDMEMSRQKCDREISLKA